MSASTISSLALLKTRYEKGHVDFLDTLRPFVGYILGKDELLTFTAAQLKVRLLEEFGLNIPQHTVDLLLRRLSKAGQISRADKKYTVVKLDNNVAEFEASRAEAIRHQNAVVDGLRKYAGSVLGRALSSDEATNVLYDYIDQYSIDCIQAYSNGSVVPVHGKSLKNWNFIVGGFVNQLSSNDPEQFRYLVTVVMGRMLSNALLGEDMSDVSMRFKTTVVYLDTPIVLQIIGVLGESPKALAEEMLQLLEKLEAKVAVFEHNIFEIDTILKKAEHSLEGLSIGRGNVYLNLMELHYSSSDVAMLRSAIADNLEKRGIRIQQTPQYVNDLQIDEHALEKEMEISGLRYRAEAAKRCDINSIRSIYVLRHKRVPRKVEDCTAIFVTNNTGLARAAYAYGHRHEESNALSTVIADFSLTNLLWLKAPMDYRSIPERMMAVSCYAALRPSDDFWTAFLVEVKKLEKQGSVTPSQLQFLRFELKIRDDLMNLTLGDEDAINDEQILQILDRHEQNLTRPLQEQIAGLRGAVDVATSQRDIAASQLNNVSSRVEGFAKIINYVVSGILVLFAGIFLALSHGLIGESVTEHLGQVTKWVFRMGIYVADSFVIMHAIFHVTIWNPVSFLAKAIEKKLIYFLKRMLGLHVDDDSREKALSRWQ